MKESSSPKPISLDDVLRRCGDFNRFQWIHYIFLNLIEASAGIVALYYVYGAGEGEHRCRLPSDIWLNDNTYNPLEGSEYGNVVRRYIPQENNKWDQCHLYSSGKLNLSLIECPNGWVFNRNVFGLTFVEESSLVCGNKWQKSWLSTLVQLAGFVLLIVGGFADRFGRRPTIIGVILVLLTVCFSMQIVMQFIPMSINVK